MKAIRRPLLVAASASLLMACGGENNDTNNTDANHANHENHANHTANHTAGNNTTPANNTTANNTSPANNTATNNTSPANNTTANNTSPTNNTTPANNTTPTCEPIEPYDGARVMSCDEQGFTACFENSECMNGERCEDIGDGIEVACCVPGPRGCKALGEPCEGDEIQCETGVCIGRNGGQELCTTACAEESEMAADCPESLPVCATIPFTAAGMYCVEADME